MSVSTSADLEVVESLVCKHTPAESHPDIHTECALCEITCVAGDLRKITDCDHKFCATCLAQLIPFYRSHVWGSKALIPHRLICLRCKDIEVRLWDCESGREFLSALPDPDQARIARSHQATYGRSVSWSPDVSEGFFDWIKDFDPCATKEEGGDTDRKKPEIVTEAP